MRVKIRLDTVTDLAKFVLSTSKLPENVMVYIRNDDNTLSIDGKSFLGLAHAKEFSTLWCECEMDIYRYIKDFVLEE